MAAGESKETPAKDETMSFDASSASSATAMKTSQSLKQQDSSGNNDNSKANAEESDAIPPTNSPSAESKTPIPKGPKDSQAEDTTTTTDSPETKEKHIPVPEIGPGWTCVTKFRKSGQSDKYYFSPKERYLLRSRAAVNRFIEALEEAKGDEVEAYAAFKNGKTNGITNGNGKADENSNANSTANGKADVKKETTTSNATTKKTPTTKPVVAKKEATTKASKIAKAVRKKKKIPPETIDGDDPVPKKPPTTYLMYTSKLRGKVTDENPGSHPVEISRLLGAIWRALPSSEKDALKATYLKDLETYKQKKKEWEIRNPGKSPKEPSITKKKRSRATIAPTKAAVAAAATAAARKIVAASPSPTKCRKKAKHNKIEGSDWWEVEDFRNRRTNPVTGKEEYLIKWKGCPESSNTWEPSSNLNAQDDAKAWWKLETTRRKKLVEKQKRIRESMERLGIEDGILEDEFDDEIDDIIDTVPTNSSSSSRTNNTVCRRSTAPPAATKATMAVLEDETWKWDDASQINFRSVQRISVHEPSAREAVTEARINGTPVVLTGHVGWANFALRWLRRKDSVDKNKREAEAATETAAKSRAQAETETETENSDAGKEPAQTGENRVNNKGEIREESKKTKGHSNGVSSESGVIPMEVSRDEKTGKWDENFSKEENGDYKPISMNNGESLTPSATLVAKESNPAGEKSKSEFDTAVEASKEPLDLSDPNWYLDIEAMSKDIGDEEVSVVRKNYDESQPISGNILASKFFEAGWKEQEASSGKRRKAVLYLHQWQFPLSVEAGKKLCHQNTPLPNKILGEDLLKYWLDRVKLDSPLQYLFMGKADTMSKIHRDNGGLAISIAPITGEKECILVHRDDGHACLYNNQAPLDPDDIDLNAYPMLPHARIWKTSIKPGEILLMPHGTYHQCRNITPCLSYSRFHLDGVNLRAFLHSMMDGDAPELNPDEVLWNATRELIDVVDKASDEKRKVDEELFKAVDALRALRNMAKEVTRKLHVRETVKGTNPSSLISSSIQIDGDAATWLSLVDDVDMCLHEFRYRFNRKIPSFKRRRSIGRKILALPALPFRGKSKPSEKEMNQGGNEPVVAFESPADRGYLALPKAPSEISPEERKKVEDAIDSIGAGDELMVRIEGRRCPARVTEVMANMQTVLISFEDLPSLYNDFVSCDLLRTPSVGGSCLTEPPPEDIKPGKLFVCLMGKDEYRGVVQHFKSGRFFKSKLDLGNGFSIDRLIDPESILSVIRNPEKPRESAIQRNLVRVKARERSAKKRKLEDTRNEIKTGETDS